MAYPTLSVVIPNYNHGHFLSDSIGAMLNQSYKPTEIIVIDDASTDDSIAVVESLAERESIIRLLQNGHNIGVAESVNRGLAFASGKYVYCASADDRVLPGFFEKSMKLLARHQEAGLCSTLSGVVNERGEYRGLVHTAVVTKNPSFLAPDQVLAVLRRRDPWFMGNTTVYRRSALMESGGFVPELGPYCDGFASLILALKYGACFIPEPMAVWRRMRGTYSHRTGSNLDLMLDVMDTASKLMQSTYRNVVPADYVHDWQKRWVCEAGRSFMNASFQAQIGGLRRLLSSKNLIDKAFLSGLQYCMTIQAQAVTLYLLARLKRRHVWEAFMRKARHIAGPRLKRSADAEKTEFPGSN